MSIQTTTLTLALVAGASLASTQDVPAPCSYDQAIDQHEPRQHCGPVRVWDPNLAQWRTEQPGRVWDPNLARYRYESSHEVWDSNLAQYRPRDARRDPPPPSRQGDGRHQHAGRQGWCFARH